MKQETDNKTLLFRAKLLLEEGKIDDAKSVLDEFTPDGKQQADEQTYLLGRYYVLKRRWEEAVRMLAPLSHIDEEEEPPDRIDRERSAICLLHLGYAAINCAHFEDGSQHLRKSLRLLQDKRVRLRHLRVKARYALAMTYTMRGLFPAAIEGYQEALRIYDAELNDKEDLAHIYHGLCDTCRRMGSYLDALDAGIKALAIYEDLGRPIMQSSMHNQLGHIYLKLADFKDSFEHFTHALAIASSYHEQKMVMLNCTALAEVRLAEERLEEAREYCELALNMVAGSNDRLLNGLTFLSTGKVTLAEARRAQGMDKQSLLQQAAEWFGKASDQLVATDSFESIQEAYGNRAQTLEDLGQNEEAVKCWKSAFAASDQERGLSWQ